MYFSSLVAYCKSRIFRMCFVFVYFVRGSFRTEIQCVLKFYSIHGINAGQWLYQTSIKEEGLTAVPGKTAQYGRERVMAVAIAPKAKQTDVFEFCQKIESLGVCFEFGVPKVYAFEKSEVPSK